MQRQFSDKDKDKDKAAKCQLMQQEGDAYLKLGPFKLEHLNTDGNYVAEVHDIISETSARHLHLVEQQGAIS